MNTFNLINAIALLACILTPTYVLYFLKYHIRKDQNHQKKMIDTLDTQFCDQQVVIDRIIYDKADSLMKHKAEIKELYSKLEAFNYSSDSFQSIAQNNFDNINVQQDYLRRTLNTENREIKERLDLLESLQNRFEHTSSESIKKLISEVDALQSLNITTQNILRRINSKEFTTELVRQWLITLNEERKQKEERDAKRSKLGRPKKQKIEEQEQEQVKETKPTEAVVSDVVNIMKDNEQDVVKLKTPKAESKRVIRSRELEKFFKENTKLTYRGFVIKFGEEAFKREKDLVYKRLYYQKFLKKTSESQQELVFKTEK